MARYLLEVGIVPNMFSALIQNPQDRAQANRPVFEAVGGKLHEYYFAVGTNTVYVVAEIPDEVSVEALTMAVLAGGTVTAIKSTAILTAAEAMEAMKKASALGYRPPSA
jgi:uncharacterized protein with GYD domain